jgi:2-phosphoglycolate phosphatase
MKPSLAVTPRAVLFDLDGTLVDTAPDLGYAANVVREELGQPPLPLANYRPVASAGARGLLGMALGITPDHADFPRHRERFLAVYRDNLTRASRPFHGIVELLALLSAYDIRWGVVTNKPSWLTDPLMTQLHLANSSACTISADQVPNAKPAPDALLRACEVLALCPEQCWYVGDDKRDITAGHAAGMATIAADWGYLGADGPIESWQADTVLATPQELQQLIRRIAAATPA